MSNNELVTTDTDENAMANPATAGGKMKVLPVSSLINRINIPAAIGIPIILLPKAQKKFNFILLKVVLDRSIAVTTSLKSLLI
ncbi:MAG: hypothetical protein GPJ54_15775, partial [Candidatus Heimdallarchaeota archaeon]|nr:hypothetical protein [Candidatus Heimdallarchaeota archaeon]